MHGQPHIRKSFCFPRIKTFADKIIRVNFNSMVQIIVPQSLIFKVQKQLLYNMKLGNANITVKHCVDWSSTLDLYSGQPCRN